MAILSSLVEPRKDGTVEPALAVALLPWKGHDEDWTDMSETAESEGASTSAMETQDRLLHAIEEVQHAALTPILAALDADRKTSGLYRHTAAVRAAAPWPSSKLAEKVVAASLKRYHKAVHGLMSDRLSAMKGGQGDGDVDVAVKEDVDVSVAINAQLAVHVKENHLQNHLQHQHQQETHNPWQSPYAAACEREARWMYERHGIRDWRPAVSVVMVHDVDDFD